MTPRARLLVVAAFLAVVSIAACGKSSSSTRPSVSGVFPPQAFIARTARIEISGDATNWHAGTTASFGPGVTVGSALLASPTALFVDITVDETAFPGLRDVTVTDGERQFVLSNAFEIRSPVEVTFEGTQAQGSILHFVATSLDPETPFDTTKTGDGLYTPITYVNLAFDTPPGVTAAIDAADYLHVTGSVFVDVSAQSGAFILRSGPAGAQVAFPAALTIAPRTPIALAPGAAAAGTISSPYESALYQLSAGANSAILFTTSSGTIGATPFLALLSSGGQFATGILGFGQTVPAVVRPGHSDYIILTDLSGNSGYPYSLTAKQTILTATLDEAETNDVQVLAQSAPSIPLLYDHGVLESASDADFVQIPIAVGDIGKSVHVITAPGNLYTDTLVDVTDCTTHASLGGPSSDLTYHENFVSSPIPSTSPLCVMIATGAAFNPSNDEYVAAIWIE